MLDSRTRLLRAALGFALVLPTEPELRLLHRWLDCWRGVGDVVAGMNRQGYWLHLSNVDAGTWRANHQAVIVPRLFLFPQRGFLISSGVAVPSGL